MITMSKDVLDILFTQFIPSTAWEPLIVCALSIIPVYLVLRLIRGS